MALDEILIRELAAKLDVAERERRQIRQFSLEHPSLGLEDAYAIQQAWVEMKIARGNRLKGHKIGLTSRAMQRAANIGEPDYGALLEDMFFTDGQHVPMHRFIEPKVEVELAFLLKNRLAGPDCTLVDVLNATDYVIPALEIDRCEAPPRGSRYEADPQGLRHHLRQRGECRRRPGRSAGTTVGRRFALGVGRHLSQRRRRGLRRGRGGRSIIRPTARRGSLASCMHTEPPSSRAR